MKVRTYSFPLLLLVLSIILSSAIGRPVYQDEQQPTLDYSSLEEICLAKSVTARVLCRTIVGQTMQQTYEIQSPQRISKRNAIDAFVNLLQEWGVKIEDGRERYQTLIDEGLIDSNGQPVGPSNAIRELMLSRNRDRIP